MKKAVFTFGICLSFYLIISPVVARAELTSGGILNEVLEKYRLAATSWGTAIQDRATWLFMVLTVISMVWTFSQLLFHRSSLAELFGEMIRFIMFTGFFLWLLRNGPQMATDIIESFKEIGGTASGQGPMSPSSLVDIGFKIVDKVCDQLSMWSPVVSAGNLILACIVLVILALIGINMLLMFCSAWVLAYAGVFFLGFGGSRWTSDMAINYFKTVLGLGASLMTMILLVGVGTNLINEYSSRMAEDIKIQELSVLLVASITLLLLVDKLPAMVSGIITGASIGSSGGGSFGAGAAVGAAMTAGGVAMGAASMGGRVAMAGASNVAGVVSAFNTARQAANPGESRDSFGMSASMGNRSSMAAEIGKGLAGMGKQAMDNAKQGFAERAQNTMGGKLAATIKNSGNSGNQGGGQ